MYGYIENNLKKNIEIYLSVKSLEIQYRQEEIIREEDIDNVIENIKKCDLKVIILESSSFQSDEIAVKFCYEIRSKIDIRVIFISFNKELLTKIAMLGVYDLIYHNKNIKLEEKMDSLLIRKNKISDIEEYLNLNIIKNKNNESNERFQSTINIISNLDRKVFSTSIFVELLKRKNEQKILYIDFFSYNDIRRLKMFEDVEKNEFEFGVEYTIGNNIFWKIEKGLDTEGIMKMILALTKRKEIIFIDISDCDIINDKKLKILKNSSGKIYFFETESIVRKASEEYLMKKKQISELEIDNEILKVEFDNEYFLTEKVDVWYNRLVEKKYADEVSVIKLVEKIKMKVKEFNLVEYTTKNK